MPRPVLALTTLVIAVTALVPTFSASASPSSTGVEHRNVRLCSAPAAGDAACDAIRHDRLNGAGTVVPNVTPSGYGPADLQSAYNLPSVTAGSGQTVAIIDAYDDPNAESDLAVYRSQFGLPACTTANGCFRKVNQNGGMKMPRANGGWAQEIRWIWTWSRPPARTATSCWSRPAARR